MSLPRRLAFIDVETTGANPVRDRITEIAVLRVEDGELCASWESLVDPQMPIPRLIQNITGISDAMVADAPVFGALADQLAALLHDCVFVAHNARFDFGFIKNAFARCGFEFDAPVLCTVKLSRALYPEYHRHGLDALIERHGLECSARHRAMGDARALWHFVQQAQARFAPEALAQAVRRAMKAPPSPPGLPEGMLEAVPDVPGVYLFFADATPAPPALVAEQPLYLGRALGLRGRVKEHFSARAARGKDAELLQLTRRVEWIETAGELDSQLLELDLRRSLQPRLSRSTSAASAAFAVRVLAHREHAPVCQRVPIAGTDPSTWQDLFGVFRNAAEADNRLRELALLYRLCPRRLGLESEARSGGCSARRNRRCAGVCVGKESAAAHDERLAGALAALRLPAWPWPGPVLVTEGHLTSERRAFHLFDQWCHLASAPTRAGLGALAAGRRPAFDVHVWRILERWFAQPAARAVEVWSGA